MALQRGEVVQELRALALLLLFELRDLAAAAADLPDDLLGEILGDPLPAEIAAAVGAALVGLERGFHEPVRLGLEGADLLLAPRDEGQRRRLHAAERHRAVEGGAEPDGGGTGGVHAHHPVGLGARAGRGLELGHLGPGPQMLERPLDGLARHRGEPQPLDRLVDAGRLVKVGEDELTLAARVAGVHDQLDVVVAHEPVDRLELLLGPLVDRDQLELLGQDRQVGEPPALELRVVLVRSRESHKVADRP